MATYDRYESFATSRILWKTQGAEGENTENQCVGKFAVNIKLLYLDCIHSDQDWPVMFVSTGLVHKI